MAVTSLTALLAGCGESPEISDDTVVSEQSHLSYPSIDRRNRPLSPIRTATGSVHYYGGPVIPNPKVYAVWWGDPSKLNPAIPAAKGGIPDFFTGITNSSYMDWMNEYDTNINAQAGSHSGSPGTNQFIGRGNYAGAIALTSIPSGNVTDAQVQAAVNSAFASHVLPAPDENTIYSIFFPPSVTITLDGSTSCVDFGAYHDVMLETTLHNAYYLIIPDCGSDFSYDTLVTSHELIEATTDGQPTPGSSPDYPQAWNDSSGNEIADLCETSSGNVTTGLGSFHVQGIYDNRSAGCKVNTTAAQDFNVSLSPNTAALTTSASQTFTVQTATSAGAAEALTLSVSAPPGVMASVSPTTVTSGSTATLTVSASSALSNQQVVVRADGAAGTHTAALLLNVTGGGTTNDFSISLTPASQTVTSSSAAIPVTFAIATAVVSGTAETVNLSVSGLTGGVTGAFNPATVTAGGSSTLTLTVPADAAASTSDFIVTGTSPSATHTAAGTLTVDTGSTSAIINGGFETGDLTGWTAAGTSTGVVNSGAHSGTYAARLGNTTPTNGDSSISQTFTVPSSASTLSFYYKMTCPDTVLHDWATATLKDNTTGKTKTILSKTCTTSTSYVEVSTAVTAGHSVTLKLVSHDNDKAGTASYTLYDDVAVQ